eukprot:ctg_350.g197
MGQVATTTEPGVVVGAAGADGVADLCVDVVVWSFRAPWTRREGARGDSAAFWRVRWEHHGGHLHDTTATTIGGDERHADRPNGRIGGRATDAEDGSRRPAPDRHHHGPVCLLSHGAAVYRSGPTAATTGTGASPRATARVHRVHHAAARRLRHPVQLVGHPDPSRLRADHHRRDARLPRQQDMGVGGGAQHPAGARQRQQAEAPQIHEHTLRPVQCAQHRGAVGARSHLRVADGQQLAHAQFHRVDRELLRRPAARHPLAEHAGALVGVGRRVQAESHRGGPGGSHEPVRTGMELGAEHRPPSYAPVVLQTARGPLPGPHQAHRGGV